MGAAGVYEIRHVPSGRVYIGSSKDIDHRWKKHRQALVRGKHHSAYLQRAWNKYGEEQFKVSPLLLCGMDQLYFYEQLCLNGLQPVFNGAKTATGPVARGQKLPKEWVDKVAVAVRKRYAEGFTVVHPPRTERYKVGVSAAVRKRYEDPAYKAKVRTALKASMTEEECAAKSARVKALWTSPEYREHAVEARKGNKFASGYKCTPEQIENRRRAARISNMKRNYGEGWKNEYSKRYPEHKGEC